jgi:hypothetical protein
MSAAATHRANRSYREVLGNRHVAGLLLGDLLANVGTGMLIVATTSARGRAVVGWCGALSLLAAVLVSVPEPSTVVVGAGVHRRGNRAGASCDAVGVAARLLVVECCFNGFYLPMAVALSRYVGGTLDADASGLACCGARWVGAGIGAALVNQLRTRPQRHRLIAVIGLWAVCRSCLPWLPR